MTNGSHPITLNEIELDVLYNIEESDEDLLMLADHVRFYYCKKGEPLDAAQGIVKRVIKSLFNIRLIELVEYRYTQIGPNYFESNEANIVTDLNLGKFLEGSENWKSKTYSEKYPIYFFEPTNEGIALLGEYDKKKTPWS